MELIQSDIYSIFRASRDTVKVIVEWRALTVCLLDEVADALRKKLGKTEEEFPLVKVSFCSISGRRVPSIP